MNEIAKKMNNLLVEELNKFAEKEIEKQVKLYKQELQNKTHDFIMKAVQGLKMHVQEINPNTLSPEIHIKIEM